MDRRICMAGLIGTAVLTVASPAFAHSLGAHSLGAGFGAGLAHPLVGLDHVLAMVAVGVWAAQSGGRAIPLLPAAFIAAMTAAAAVGMAGIALPAIELGILASVLLLGGVIAVNSRLPLPLGMAVVGLFAVFHGNAHGVEAPIAANPLHYAAGFALATALLHGVGIGLTLAAARFASSRAVRLAGSMIAAGGLALAAAA